MHSPSVLFTDMDRTIIPNGPQPEPPGALSRFRAFCKQLDIQLVYTTGRDCSLVQSAIEQYALPLPDYLITDVGSLIYRSNGSQREEWTLWTETIANDWPGRGREDIVRKLSSIDSLRLQEPEKQNRHKVSYYVPTTIHIDQVSARIEEQLGILDMSSNLIWSIDESSDIGLLDILPRSANKLAAIEFIYPQLGYSIQDILFAGDSGNDLPVLTSRIRSILVGNATEDIREQSMTLSEQNGTMGALYIADEYYSDGVLEGVRHWFPEMEWTDA